MTAVADERGLRELIRHHATRLFAARGFAGTTIREVAAACGCTKPALYYYYSSKETLYRDVIAYHSETISSLIENTVDGTGKVRQRLHGGLDDIIEYAMAQPLGMQLIQRSENSPEDTAPHIDTKAMREAHMHMLTKLMRTGIESGELRANLDPLDGALIVAGAVHFQIEQSIATGEWDQARIHRSIDLVLDGISLS